MQHAPCTMSQHATYSLDCNMRQHQHATGRQRVRRHNATDGMQQTPCRTQHICNRTYNSTSAARNMQRTSCKQCVVRCELRVASRPLSVAQSVCCEPRGAWHTAVLPRASTSSSSTTWHAIALQHVATRCNQGATQPSRRADESDRDRPTSGVCSQEHHIVGLSVRADSHGAWCCTAHVAMVGVAWRSAHRHGPCDTTRGSFSSWRRCWRQVRPGYAHFARSVARIGDIVTIAHAKHGLGEHVRPCRVEDLRESPHG